MRSQNLLFSKLRKKCISIDHCVVIQIHFKNFDCSTVAAKCFRMRSKKACLCAETIQMIVKKKSKYSCLCFAMNRIQRIAEHRWNFVSNCCCGRWLRFTLDGIQWLLCFYFRQDFFRRPNLQRKTFPIDSDRSINILQVAIKSLTQGAISVDLCGLRFQSCVFLPVTLN